MQFSVTYVAAAMAIAAAALPQAQTNSSTVQCIKDSSVSFSMLRADCEAAIKKLNTPGDEDVDGGPFCDRMSRNEHDFVTVGTCTVTSLRSGNAHCQEPKDVAIGAQKVLDACKGKNARLVWAGDAVVSEGFKVALQRAEPSQAPAPAPAPAPKPTTPKATAPRVGEDNWVWSK